MEVEHAADKRDEGGGVKTMDVNFWIVLIFMLLMIVGIFVGRVGSHD